MSKLQYLAHELLDHEAVAEAFGLGDVARGVDERGETCIADFMRPDSERRDLTKDASVHTLYLGMGETGAQNKLSK